MNIQSHVLLADKNWFATGGAARFFCEPTTAAEFKHAIEFAADRPLFVLGSGANILISDEGFDGLVIRPQLKSIEQLENGRIKAGAGVIIDDLITYALDHQLADLEEFSAIPGTIGGSAYINIHYFDHLLSDFLVEAEVIERATGLLSTVPREWFQFGYDHSRLFERTHFVVSATFQLRPVSTEEAHYQRGRRDEITRHRHRRYPRSNSCGSFFRNFHEHEVPFLTHGRKIKSVAYYLDKIGAKGEFASGGAIVSHQHANMLVTREGATSADVINLARLLQTTVQARFGITPQAECQFIGFASSPLL